MSRVYLVTDLRLEKVWAMKVLSKKGRNEVREGSRFPGKEGEEGFKTDSVGRPGKPVSLGKGIEQDRKPTSYSENDKMKGLNHPDFSEIRIMKDLDHPMLPRVVDCYEDEEQIYLIMDYVSGENLETVLQEKGVFSQEQVLSWGIALCQVLSYLHNQNPGILYRDMKPGNLLLTKDRQLKLVDFGIAGREKAALGTRGFAPPEQYRGECDPRSDVFSLGKTLHFLLTGADPRESVWYRDPGNYRDDISLALRKVILKATETDPEARFQSAAEMEAALKGILERRGEFGSAEEKEVREGEQGTFGKKRDRKRKGRVFLAVAILLLFLGLGIFWGQRNIRYHNLLATENLEHYSEAMGIFPRRIKAYEAIFSYYRVRLGAEGEEQEKLQQLAELLAEKKVLLKSKRAAVATLYYEMGKLYFSQYEGTLREKALGAAGFFSYALEGGANFPRREEAECFSTICTMILYQGNAWEYDYEAYEEALNQMEEAFFMARALSGNEANYDRVTLYYAAVLFLVDQAENLAKVGIKEERVLALFEEAIAEAAEVQTTLVYVENMQEKLSENAVAYRQLILGKYGEMTE